MRPRNNVKDNRVLQNWNDLEIGCIMQLLSVCATIV